MFSFRLTERATLLVLVDLVIVELTTLLAFWVMAIRAGWLFDRNYLLDQFGWFVLLPAAWFLSAVLNGFYDPKKITDLTTTAAVLFRIVLLVIVAYFAIYFFFATPGSLPRGIVGYQGVASFVLIAVWRTGYVLLFRRPGFARKVIIVGAGWAGQTMAQTIQQHANVYYRILGFVDDDPAKRPTAPNLPAGIEPQTATRLPVLGAATDLLRLVKEQDVPEVILAISHGIETPLFHALLECKEQGVQITLMPVLYEQLTGSVPIEHIGDHWNVALPLDSAEASGFYPIAKRLFDIVWALIGLTLFAALFPLIAIALYLNSPGPLFYTQKRVGKSGKIFNLIKLRTMIPNAEVDGRAQRAQPDDPRVTRVGRLLRMARLDEMPQLINILKGDMSAVGPRPERPEHLAELDQAIPFHRLRNAVKPGMAGWAVVNYDYVESVEDARMRLQYDLYYIKHQSLWLDLVILLRTMGHMVKLKGR